jgi:hypothetical protein
MERTAEKVKTMGFTRLAAPGCGGLEAGARKSITGEELVEIIPTTAMGNYADRLANALKIEVEPAVADALGRLS